MRYDENLTEEIRERNDIVDVISSYVSLKKKGADYFGLCPFHNEKTPSFSVSRNKQLFYCFGCHKGGNVYTFLMEYNRMSFLEAMEELAGRVGIEIPEQEKRDQERQDQDARQGDAEEFEGVLRREPERRAAENVPIVFESHELRRSHALGQRHFQGDPEGDDEVYDHRHAAFADGIRRRGG